MQLRKISKRILFAMSIATVMYACSVSAQTIIFTRNLSLGMYGEDVLALQQFLNTDNETLVTNLGAGSPGNETNYFGPATKNAVMRFQEKYNAEVLTPWGLSSGTGFFGQTTREKINTLMIGGTRAVSINSATQVVKNSEALSAETSKFFGVPVRIIIPSINVDASIVQVGLNSDGSMGIPTGPTETAWYSPGPRPGEIGSAVINGHYGWKDGIHAVFDDLSKLNAGDKIYVVDENRATTVFVVREIKSYDQNADASDVFGSSDGKAHLNLITCEGTWNKTEKSYSNRLVAFADRE